MLTVSVCIACYKSSPFLQEAIDSCRMQTLEPEVVVYYDDEGIGTGEAFNRAVAKATGDIVVLLCDDDVFTDKNVISDIVAIFAKESIVHVSRWYYQFEGNDRTPVRAWRSENVVELGNNPSGLAFRRSAMGKLSNRLFLESADLVSEIIKKGAYQIMRWDTIAVRIHKSNSRTPSHYAKYWKGSIVKEWAKLGWKSKDYASLIQIKVNYTTKAVIDEAKNFILVGVSALWSPAFWFFFVLAVCVPRKILYKIPELYRRTCGKWTTREVKRP